MRVDAESYNYELISNFKLNQSKSKIVSFEHGLLDGNTGTSYIDDSEFQKIKDILHKNGHDIWVEKYDTVALIPGILNI